MKIQFSWVLFTTKCTKAFKIQVAERFLKVKTDQGSSDLRAEMIYPISGFMYLKQFDDMVHFSRDLVRYIDYYNYTRIKND
ncbi:MULTISPECIES: hypothetical protein [unclassified Exiguobacterium]|uniref:hypothetical protein n=1 Tax=unclassified Exiguobacterium TaxID=2644629 RepID=UPI00137645FE|nr:MULTISPECIES: hypothetical protein [unclassified Exiguobacterium]